MTVYYVASTGSATAPYDTWAKAATALDTITALTGAGDVIYIKNETFTIAADKTYTFAGTLASPCRLISTSDTTNAPPTSVATGATIDGTGTSLVDITISGKVYMYGCTFKAGNGANAGQIILTSADESMLFAENCGFTCAGTSASSLIYVGSSSGFNTRLTSLNCTWTTANNASAGMQTNSTCWQSYGDTFGITTTVPTTYVKTMARSARIEWFGADLSAITSTLFPGATTEPVTITLANSKLGSGVAILGTATGPAHSEAYVYDCASGDTHYEFGHYNYWGNTTISTAINLTGTNGASYNAADAKHSWKVTGVNGTFATPYISPWLSVYNEGVSAVTPRLEVLRDGSATAYNNDEVWPEFGAKATASSTRLTLYSGRRGLVAAAAAQASSALGASDWSGEGGTAWFGKLEPTSTITPAEIGDVLARVCVAGANTVYLNPKILGL